MALGLHLGLSLPKTHSTQKKSSGLFELQSNNTDLRIVASRLGLTVQAQAPKKKKKKKKRRKNSRKTAFLPICAIFSLKLVFLPHYSSRTLNSEIQS